MAKYKSGTAVENLEQDNRDMANRTFLRDIPAPKMVAPQVDTTCTPIKKSEYQTPLKFGSQTAARIWNKVRPKAKGK
jgi:hypothetical protein